MKNKKKLPIIAASVISFTVAAVGGYLFQTIWHNNVEIPNASIVKVDSDDSDNSNSVDVSLQYSGYVTLLNDENRITLNFTNPAKSKKSFSIDIVANINGEDIILAKTDKIKPGYKIDSINSDLDYKVPTGDYKGKFILHFYDNNNIEEIVGSEIAINVYVK